MKIKCRKRNTDFVEIYKNSMSSKGDDYFLVIHYDIEEIGKIYFAKSDLKKLKKYIDRELSK